MKKLLLLCALFSFVAFSANAQKKSCAYSKAAKSEKVCSVTAAAKLASQSPEIEKRVCAKSGSEKYVRKSVCSSSGKVSYKDVEYCTKSGKFVNLSPSQTKKASCTKSKAACTKKAGSASNAMKVSQKAEKKSCSMSKAACAKSKAACSKGAKSTAVQGTKAKLVKAEEK